MPLSVGMQFWLQNANFASFEGQGTFLTCLRSPGPHGRSTAAAGGKVHQPTGKREKLRKREGKETGYEMKDKGERIRDKGAGGKEHQKAILKSR